MSGNKPINPLFINSENHWKGKPSFIDQYKKIIKRYEIAGYTIDIMRQSECLVISPIKVYKWFPLELQDSGQGLRLIDAPDVNLY